MWTIVNGIHQAFCLHPDRPIYRVDADGTKVLECTRCFKKFPGSFQNEENSREFTPTQILSYGELAR